MGELQSELHGEAGKHANRMLYSYGVVFLLRTLLDANLVSRDLKLEISALLLGATGSSVFSTF
jgi:hypothetical protein